MVPLMVGKVVAMVKGTAVDVPPPGFSTLTKAVPAVAIKEAGTKALNWLLENEVVRAVVVVPEFHWITEPVTKFAPITSNWKAGPPAAADDGTRGGVIDGVVPGAIVKTWELELTEPGFCTATRAEPGLASRDAGIVAVKSEAST